MTRTSASKYGGAPRAIVVGAGLMGRHHARAAVAVGATIVAIVDRNPEAARALASRFDGAVSAAGLGTIEADAVHICTPAETHVEFAERAAASGLHALIEKPLAATADETERVFQIFGKAGLIACPAHQYAFQRSVRAAAESLPRLGPVRSIAFDICSAGAARSGMDLDELVEEILPHPLAMLQRLLPTAGVSDLNWSCLRSAPGEWLISAQAGGTVLSIGMSMSGRPTRFLTRITADRGSLELDNFHDYCVEFSGQVSTARKIAQPFVRGAMGLAAAGSNLIGRAARGELAYPGLATLVEQFYAAVRDCGTAPPPITPQQAIAVAKARDTIAGLALDD